MPRLIFLLAGHWDDNGTPDDPDDDFWVDGDYRLRAGSPCIDAGDNDAVPNDILDLDGDGDTGEPIPFDLAGGPRFLDDPTVPDTGQGTPPIVDMGAYEARAVRFVDDDAPLGGDGLSWSTAYRYLQDALAEARDNSSVTEIRVAQGTYKPDQSEYGHATPGNRYERFNLVDGVDLRGGYAGRLAVAQHLAAHRAKRETRDVARYETILSGDLNGDDAPEFENYDDNSLHVVYACVVGETTRLDGFVVERGNADDEDDGGGGMLLLAAHPALHRLHLSQEPDTGSGVEPFS